MAEDAVQDVFVAFAQTNSRIRPAGDLRKYLVTCVVNRIRNHRRDQQRHGACDIENVHECSPLAVVDPSSGPYSMRNSYG